MRVTPEKLAEKTKVLMEYMGYSYRDAFGMVCRKTAGLEVSMGMETNEHGQDRETLLPLDRANEDRIFNSLMLQDHILKLVAEENLRAAQERAEENETYKELRARLEDILAAYSKTRAGLNEILVKELGIGDKAYNVYDLTGKASVRISYRKGDDE